MSIDRLMDKEDMVYINIYNRQLAIEKQGMKWHLKQHGCLLYLEINSCFLASGDAPWTDETYMCEWENEVRVVVLSCRC